VIIFDLNFMGVSILPFEDDTISIIDPNAVKSFEISLERLQPVVRRRQEIIESRRRVDHVELSTNHFENGLVDPRMLGAHTVEKVFGGLVAERKDHTGSSDC
jgi:hypothetical protein